MMASGKDRDQIDARMVLTVEATPKAKELAERLVRRRDTAAGLRADVTAELLEMLGIDEGAA